MTLRYNMQLLDELPMVYGSGMLVYTLYDLILSIDKFNSERFRKQRSNLSILTRLFQSRLFVSCLILIYCLLFTFIYLFIWKNPIFHEVSYSLMVLVIVIESFTLIRKLQCSKRIYLLSLVYYLFGFFLWNLDNNFCAYLKHYRNFIDKLVGYNPNDYSNLSAVCFNVLAVLLKTVFEFHSLWHLFTGYASFMTILFLTDCVYLKHIKENKLNMDNPVIKTKYFNLYYCLNELTVKENDETKNNKE
jgi:dihydroceramidase